VVGVDDSGLFMVVEISCAVGPCFFQSLGNWVCAERD